MKLKHRQQGKEGVTVQAHVAAHVRAHVAPAHRWHRSSCSRPGGLPSSGSARRGCWSAGRKPRRARVGNASTHLQALLNDGFTCKPAAQEQQPRPPHLHFFIGCLHLEALPCWCCTCGLHGHVVQRARQQVRTAAVMGRCHATRWRIACSTVQCCRGGSPKAAPPQATAFLKSTIQTAAFSPHLELPAAHIHETDAAGAGGGRQAGVGAQRRHLRDTAASGRNIWTRGHYSQRSSSSSHAEWGCRNSWVRAAGQQATATSRVLGSRMRRLGGRRRGCCCPGEPPPPCR